MAQIRVEQIADLGIVTDENGVKHIVIGSDTITPIEGIQGISVVNTTDNTEETNTEEE